MAPTGDRACSRCRELGLARIRDANRFLADPRLRSKDAVSGPPLYDQRFRLQRLSACRRRGTGRRLGVHGARVTCRCRSTRWADQAGMIAKTMGEIAAFTGRAPAGWPGPGSHGNASRRRTCWQARGSATFADWVVDDLPLAALPNNQRCRCSPCPTPSRVQRHTLIMIQHHRGSEFEDRANGAARSACP